MASETLQPPTVAEADGWTVTSSSTADQPTAEQIVERISDEGAGETQPPAEEPEDTERPQPATPEPTDTQQPAAPKKKQTAAERHAELQARTNAETRAFHEARRAREAEEARFEQVRREREEFAQAQAAPAKPAISAKPMWSEYEEAGKSYDQFLDDRDTWNRQEIQAAFEHRERGQREQYERSQQHQFLQNVEAQHQARIQTAAQKHPDFLELVNQNLSDVPESAFVTEMVKGHEQGAELLYHLAQHPDEARVLGTLTPSRPLRDALRMSEMPVELASYFAQHPQECDRLSRLHPAPALVALGEIQAQLKGAKNGSPGAQTISHAKPPTRPVSGARAGASTSDADMPFGPEWIAAENKRERERRIASRRF